MNFNDIEFSFVSCHFCWIAYERVAAALRTWLHFFREIATFSSKFSHLTFFFLSTGRKYSWFACCNCDPALGGIWFPEKVKLTTCFHELFKYESMNFFYQILCIVFVLIFSNTQNWEKMPFLTNKKFAFSTEKYGEKMRTLNS